MEWTTEHDMIFCREVIAFDLYHYKLGSQERGQCGEYMWRKKTLRCDHQGYMQSTEN